MITFLPSRCFTTCAKVLDDQRLSQQIREAKYILDAVQEGEQVGQPAFDMWRPYPRSLAIYGKLLCDEWFIRFKSVRSEMVQFDQAINRETFDVDAQAPTWLGDRRLHLSHVRALVMKNADYYAAWLPVLKMPAEYCCVGCNYWWPSHAGVR